LGGYHDLSTSDGIGDALTGCGVDAALSVKSDDVVALCCESIDVRVT